MAKKKAPKPDDAKQSQQFVETAKKLEADETGRAFEKVFNRVVRTNPVTFKKKTKSN